MANVTSKPNLLTDPGFLFWAPLGTTVPTHTVLANKFTDTWPVAWINLGATDVGSDFTVTTTVQPVAVAEFLDPIAYRSTDRTGSWAFALADITATNLSRTFNGAATTVTGATTTTLTQVSPVVLGQETRCMIGWESLDATCRIIGYQVFNSGAIKMTFAKAPHRTTVPWMGMFEIPAATNKPWDIWTAGLVRA